MSAVGTLEILGFAEFNITANCTKVNITQAIIKFDSLSLSNVKVDIDLGPIKVNVGDIASVILKLIPSIKPAIESAVSSAVDSELPPLFSTFLPCFPTPTTHPTQLQG